MNAGTWDKEALWGTVRAYLSDHPGSTVKDIADGIEPLQREAGPLRSRIYVVLHDRIATGEVDREREEDRRVFHYKLTDPEEERTIAFRMDPEEYRRLYKIARKLTCRPEEAARILTLAGIQYMEGVR